MSPRYVLIVGAAGRQRDGVVAQVSRLACLDLAFANSQLAVLTDASCPCLAIGEGGCVLGSLFHRHGPASAIDQLSAHEVSAIGASGGQSLLRAFWGRYVAAIASPEGVRVLRDPSGDFPCYFTTQADFTIFAADADLLFSTGLVPVSIDHEEIGRQLWRAFVPVPTTALRGVSELLAGFAVRLSAETVQQEPCWSPWDHVGRPTLDSKAAADRLARVVLHSVQALASTSRRSLISVSGGLDSSIVAACLAKAGADAVCLTMYSGDPAGDERPYARALCDKLGLPLLECAYRIDDIDLDQPLAPNLPRPKDRLQAQAFERAHYAIASEIGASAFVTGNGGDHVYGYSQSAAPVADLYLAEGLGRATFSSMLDVCRQTGCSLIDAMRQAWRLTRGPSAYKVRPNPLFLHPDFVAGLGPKDWHHPYLDAPAGALPGKAAHVATIVRVQPNLEPSLGTAYPVLNPLISQPIVEECLAIPSWQWREGGRDRALARRAFARELPPVILTRRVKGTPGRFAALVLDHFRKAIRERLADGHLAQKQIIDAPAISAILAGERPVPGLERVRLLELVNAEAWIDFWTARNRNTANPHIGCP